MPENIPTKLIGGIVLAAAIGVGAYLWLGTGTPEPTSLQTDGDTTAGNQARDTVDTQEILTQLNRLRAIDMDTSVFNSPAFLSLQDFAISISEQPIGRENPFIQPASTIQGTVISPNTPVNQRPLDQYNSEDEEADTDPTATDTAATGNDPARTTTEDDTADTSTSSNASATDESAE